MAKRLDRLPPYVGVSGVVNHEQQYELIAAAAEPLEEYGRKLALGVKMTHRSQFKDREDTFGPLWSPIGDQVKTSLDHRDNASFNVAQVYFNRRKAQSDPAYVKQFVEKVFLRAGRYIDAIQVDLEGLEDDNEVYSSIIREIGKTGLTRRIIQCHSSVLEGSPRHALDDLKRMADSREVSYIFFNASRGRGVPLDAEGLLPFLDAAYSDDYFARMGTNFGVAGGLNGDNLEALLEPLIQQFREISWDAEKSLHTSLEDGGNGSLDMMQTRRYLHRSLELIHKYL